MPVITLTPRRTANRESLVDELAAEWKGKNSLRGPMILVDEIGQTRSIHVVVIWDKWGSIPDQERSAIILDAYDKVPPPPGMTVTMAMGETRQEALSLGFLPYRVAPALRQTDPYTLDQLRKAMVAEGAVETAEGLELAFPSEDLANAAHARLNRKYKSVWTVTRRVQATT